MLSEQNDYWNKVVCLNFLTKRTHGLYRYVKHYRSRSGCTKTMKVGLVFGWKLCFLEVLNYYNNILSKDGKTGGFLIENTPKYHCTYANQDSEAQEDHPHGHRA